MCVCVHMHVYYDGWMLFISCWCCRVKAVLKSLTSIGGHLSQSKEYRDIYDDILNIVSQTIRQQRSSLYGHQTLLYINSVLFQHILGV